MTAATPLAALRELLLRSNMETILPRKLTGREAGLLAEWLIAEGVFAQAEALEREREGLQARYDDLWNGVNEDEQAALKERDALQARVAALEAQVKELERERP
jgi:hypothetical protein